MSHSLLSESKSRIAGLALLAALMFVWPIPHTISLRYVFVLPALGLFSYLVARDRLGFWHPRLTLPASMLGAFVLWMVGIAVFHSSETAWSLGEIRGQWIMPLIVCYLGILAAKGVARHSRGELILTLVILLPLIAHIVVVDVQGVQALLVGKHERIAGLTERADTSNYLTNITLALLMAETFVRLRGRRPLFAIGNGLLGLLLCAAVASLVFEHIRNGIVVVAILVVVLAVALLSDLRRAGGGLWVRAVVVGCALLIMIGVIAGAASAKYGSSWDKMLATVSMAWDTEQNRQWLNPDLLLSDSPDGQAIDTSAYLRVAWFKEGIKLVAEHPLGVGYGRNVFGHQISKKYRVHFSYHSHSSALDLTIGTGIPGIVLWFGFLGVLVVGGWRRLWVEGNGYALALILIVVEYGARSVIDSNVRDHMLQQFLFLVGVLSYLSFADARTSMRADQPD